MGSQMRSLARSPFAPIAVLAVLLALAATGVFAENIVATNQYAYSEREGWINFKPGTGPGITVTSTDVTGYAWGERIGWVSMSCHNDEPGTACASRGNWEVTNDGAGNLAGYAWSERDGWISFSCKNTNPTCTGPDGSWGVNISTTTGIFSGQAWGENIGWITFSCPGSTGCGSVAYSVVTAWRPGPVDTDGDGCTDVKELGPSHNLGGQRDPTNPWDFADVPAPALLPSDPTGVRNKVISLSDVLADLPYVGTSAANPNTANTSGAKYGTDLNLNGILDGREYDRTPSTVPGEAWHSGAPDGVVSLSDVLVVLAQVGTNCS